MPAGGKTEKESEAQVDNSANASAESEKPSGNSGTKNKSYTCHWTSSVLQGDEDGSNEFGYPTIYADTPVELTSAQYEKANAASISALGYRLREWEGDN